MFTCYVPDKENNAIELLSLNPADHKHMICYGHATDVNSVSLGRPKKKKSQFQPHDTFESFALRMQFAKWL